MVEHCCKVLKDITCSTRPSNEEKETKVGMAKEMLDQLSVVCRVM